MKSELNYDDKINFLLDFIENKIKIGDKNESWVFCKDLLLSYKTDLKHEEEFEVVDKIFHSSLQFTDGFLDYVKEKISV